MSSSNPAGMDAQRMMAYDANKKSAPLGYALWFFLGSFGAHRFYMGKTGSAVAMLVLNVASFVLTFIVIGLFGYAALGLWWLIDAFLLAGWITEYNNRLIAGLR